MTWKIINVDSVGQANVYGGNDIKKIMKLLRAYDLLSEDSTDEININTEINFYSDKLRIRSPTTGFHYIWRTQDIAADRYISLPLMTGDGEIALASTTAINDWGTNLQTFRNQNIAFRNPANTFSYFWVTSAIAASRNIILPLLTGDDTLVFANHPASLANKTLVSPTITAMNLTTDGNTIKHSTTNNAGDLLVNNGTKFERKTRGGPNQVFAMNSTGTDTTWLDQSAISGGGGGGSSSDTFMPSTGGRATGVWYGATDTGASGILNGRIAARSAATAAYFSSATKWTGREWAVNSSSTESGLNSTATFTQRNMNPDIEVAFQFDQLADFTGPRLYIGFTSDPTASHNASDSLDSKSGIVLHQESASSSWNATTNDGDADQNATSLQTADSNIHKVRVFADETNSRFGLKLDNAAITYYDSEIPAATTPLGWIVSASRSDSTNRTLRIFYIKYSHDIPAI